MAFDTLVIELKCFEMEEPMKRYLAADILSHVFIPLTAYLLTGLMVIKLGVISVNVTYYVVWGVMAGIIMAVKEYFANKTVTVGIGVYAAVIVIWCALSAGDNNKVHAAMAVVGLCGMVLYQKIFRYRIIKVLSGYAALVMLICLEWGGISLSKGIIALAIVLFLNSVSETISVFYQGNVNSLIIIYAVIAMITVIMPAPEEAYDWNFVKKAVYAVQEMVENVVLEIQYRWGSSDTDGIFHYGYTGYSDLPMALSTGLNDTDIEQLRLHGERTKRNFYLRGNVCDTYTGNSWETNIVEETMNYQTDTLMTLYAIFQYTQDKSELGKFMKVYQQEVTMQNIKTQSLFYPLKLLDIEVTGIHNEGDNLRADKINVRGYSYSYQFVDIDYANSQLIDIIANGKDMIYEEDIYNLIFDKMQEYYDVELEGPAFLEFLRQVEQGQKAVEEQYTVLGDEVSEEVVNLAHSITENCVSDYEKCKALESYLYQYNYNKKIEVPDDVNVLDWFLFQGKEGYCAHYATALAVMLRCEGIPSRLAEGFLVDYKDCIDFYNYSVSSQTAHVWVEAYIEGFGWIRLEPTAPNASNAYAVWYAQPSAGEDNEAQEEEEAEEEVIIEPLETHPQEEKENIWIIMGVMLGGMAVIVMMILGILLVYKRVRIRKSNDPDVILTHLLTVLGKRYSPKEDGETVREYFTRLLENEHISEESQGNLVKILELMEGYWYGAWDIKECDVKVIKEVRDSFLE